MSNSLNKTSLGARTSRSSQQHQNASHEDSFSTLVLPGEEDRRAEIQQLAHDQYRTPLEIDPQEELCFYKTRTSNPIPSSVRTWVLLQQHDFVTALAMGHLPFDSLTYTELYWYVQLMDAVFFCFVEFIKLAHPSANWKSTFERQVELLQAPTTTVKPDPHAFPDPYLTAL